MMGVRHFSDLFIKHSILYLECHILSELHLSLQVDNKGNHLLVHEESSINVPAIAAAHVIKRYIAQAADELSFEVTGLK